MAALPCGGGSSTLRGWQPHPAGVAAPPCGGWQLHPASSNTPAYAAFLLTHCDVPSELSYSKLCVAQPRQGCDRHNGRHSRGKDVTIAMTVTAI
eukprot:355086-Chlamydomonas_euryale.AAC.14